MTDRSLLVATVRWFQVTCVELSFHRCWLSSRPRAALLLCGLGLFCSVLLLLWRVFRSYKSSCLSVRQMADCWASEARKLLPFKPSSLYPFRFWREAIPWTFFTPFPQCWSNLSPCLYSVHNSHQLLMRRHWSLHHTLGYEARINTNQWVMCAQLKDFLISALIN